MPLYIHAIMFAARGSGTARDMLLTKHLLQTITPHGSDLLIV